MTHLHHELVAGAAATAWALMTHGIYGSGANWRRVARAVVERRPGWGVALVDLRLHGRSGAGAPPHTVAACARDLAELAGELTAAGRPVRVALGHSFGGKVVLAARRELVLEQYWMLDASPGPRPGAWDAPGNTVRAAWQTLVDLDRTWARRDDFVAAAVAAGQPAPLMTWLAMNLEPAAGGLRLRLDLDGVRALLLDYYAADLWPVLTDPAAPGQVHVVVAERSTAIDAGERARLDGLDPARVRSHRVAADHWLHLDAPDAVIGLIAGGLPPP